MSKPLEKTGYQDLARRIRSGHVVFFFGAGMSIDGEGNTADRLLTRLVVRFWAIASVLNDKGVEKAKDLTNDLHTVFELPAFDQKKKKESETDQEFHEGYLSKIILPVLRDRYYDFNDWVCSSFDTLLPELRKTNEADQYLLKLITKEETHLMHQWAPGDRVPLNKIDPELVKLAVKIRNEGAPENDAGKALFLETMGFRDAPGVMGGDAGEPDHRKAAESYYGKLQERHWIVARFAREGWCPYVLTANFDRLLEGAFRLSGFHLSSQTGEKPSPPVPIPGWSTVASPSQFFDMAGHNATALVVKIHGCSKHYEELCKTHDKTWKKYLKSMVFTFREIQNWREDAWSRDYLRTLLRTRSMVFCGYSARDPVIHDTLRSVYEEMGKYRNAPVDPNKTTKTPAFFFSANAARDFHGIEILRAAGTAATGKGIDRTDPHPNFLDHRFREATPEKATLPDTDDVFLWTNHLAFRACQRDFLRQELRSLYALLIDRKRIDEITIKKILRDFDLLCKEEEKLAESLSSDRDGHEKLRELTRWTYYFHPNLLREFACAEAGRMSQGHSEWGREMRLLEHYYFPASGRPAWTAWAVVIELALRKVANKFGRAAVLFSEKSQVGRLPRELLIHHPGLEKRGKLPRVKGAALTQTVWELSTTDHPWPTTGDSTLKFERPFFRARGHAPSALTIWNWLRGDELDEAHKLVGIKTPPSMQ